VIESIDLRLCSTQFAKLPEASSTSPLQNQWVSRVSYLEAERLQNELVAQIQEEGNGVVLGLEHPDVISLGVRGNRVVDVLLTDIELHEKQCQLAMTRRGGHATLHSPGQLVIYPILRLRDWSGLSVKCYLSALERATFHCANEFSISLDRKGVEPGLYSDRGKIAFFGVRIDRGVTSHGVSININNDLSKFSWINSCNIKNESFDSFQSRGVNATLEEVFAVWMRKFNEIVL
jgi:lipoyl(octanoyl) transferase